MLDKAFSIPQEDDSRTCWLMRIMAISSRLVSVLKLASIAEMGVAAASIVALLLQLLYMVRNPFKSCGRTGLDDEEVGSLGRPVADAREDEARDGVFVSDHSDELGTVAHSGFAARTAKEGRKSFEARAAHFKGDSEDPFWTKLCAPRPKFVHL
jgi:hypothetical protein